MATAAATSNLQNFNQKSSKETYLRNEEALKDRVDLAKINASTLNPSATMSAGATGFKGF